MLGFPLAVMAPAQQTYRGFAVDVSAIAKPADLPDILAATRKQIDIVHSVGLPADIMTFLQQVKLELVPAGTFKSATPGRYRGRQNQSVQISAKIVTIAHRPVLLHELMHAFHEQHVEHGFKNQDILSLYEQAQAKTAYAARSHMMSNEKEYFACAATAYLYGLTAQEPFTREKIRRNQQDAYEFLKKLFGADAGNYVGYASP